eukprot:7017045-Alexandrium_andersonii.AAC.1
MYASGDITRDELKEKRNAFIKELGSSATQRWGNPSLCKFFANVRASTLCRACAGASACLGVR